MVRLRWRLRRYFAAGEMCRPPRLEGEIPPYAPTGSGGENWWVTTDAVMTGAWRLPTENKLVLMFVNVSDSPVSTRFHFDGRQYGVESQQVRVTIIDQESTLDTFVAPNAFDRELGLPPRSAVAWEICPVVANSSETLGLHPRAGSAPRGDIKDAKILESCPETERALSRERALWLPMEPTVSGRTRPPHHWGP